MSSMWLRSYMELFDRMAQEGLGRHATPAVQLALRGGRMVGARMWDLSHMAEVVADDPTHASLGEPSWVPPADLSLFLSLPDWEVAHVHVGAGLTLHLVSPSGMAMEAQLEPLKDVVEPPAMPLDMARVARFAHAPSFWASRARKMMAFHNDPEMAPVFLLPPCETDPHPLLVVMSRFHAYIEPLLGVEVSQPVALPEGMLRGLEQMPALGAELHSGSFGVLVLSAPGLSLLTPGDGRRIYREALLHVLAQVEHRPSARLWASPQALFAHLRPHYATLSYHRDEDGLSLHIQGSAIVFRSPHRDRGSFMSTSSQFSVDRAEGEGQIVILRRMMDLLMTFLDLAHQEVELRMVGNILAARAGDRRLIMAGAADLS